MHTYSKHEYVFILRPVTDLFSFAQMQSTQRCPVLPPGRTAGTILPVASLPGRYGIGEIGSEAFRFVDTLRKMGLTVWQFLPLGPTGYGDSPYQSLSTFAGNTMLIDIDDLIHKGLLTSDEVAGLRDLPADRIDYGELISRKSSLLDFAASRFAAKANSDLKSGFDNFLERSDARWLKDYALFRVLKSRHGERAWPEWPAQFVHHDPAALAKLEKDAAVEIDRVKVLQYLFFEQWQRLRNYANSSGIYLFGDMPIYVALDSADAWANRDILDIDIDGRADFVSGVPPDMFSRDGQFWGNPLYDWQMNAKTGYRWWIDRVAAAIQMSDIVRIDHFIGFAQYWSIPADAESAKTGTWHRGPGDPMFQAITKALGPPPIVAENLGVITPEVEALRMKHNIPGMTVIQCDVSEKKLNLDGVTEDCVCYTGTHDNDTTKGWFQGSPIDARTEQEILADRDDVLQATGGTAETIALDVVKTAFATRASLAVAPIQDFLELGSEARINTPGTRTNNWRWRVSQSQLSDEFCEGIANIVIQSGRDSLLKSSGLARVEQST